MNKKGFSILPVILIVGALIGLGSVIINKLENKSLGAINFTPVQTQKTSLYGAGVASTDSSIVLTNLVLPDGSTKITMSNFGSIGYATLEPGTSKEESISFTGITQNANGTATLTGVLRGLRFVYPYDQVLANEKSHAGGSILVITNSSAYYSQFVAKNSDGTIAGNITFASTSVPTIDSSLPGTITLAQQLATKSYVDNVALVSAPNADTVTRGVVQIATNTDVASSTGLGSTGARVVIPSSAASSSPYTNQVGIIPATQNNGKISQSYLDLTQNANITGQYTFGGATTTVKGFEASSTAANPLKLNGLNYNISSSRAASSTVLTEDGNGNLLFLPEGWQLITSQNFSGVATGTVSFTSTAKKLKVLIYDGGASAGVSSLKNFTFNASTTGYSYQNYVDYHSYASVKDSTLAKQNHNNFSIATTSVAYITMDIQNDASLRKIAKWEGSYSLGTSVPDIVSGTTIWNNLTDQLTSIDFHAYRWGDTVGTWTDLRVAVYGIN